MKKLTYYLAGLSVVLNIYYLATWFYASSLKLPQGQTVQRFTGFYPYFITLNIINLAAIILTAVSVALLLKYKDEVNKNWLIPLAVTQIACLLFYIWGYL